MSDAPTYFTEAGEIEERGGMFFFVLGGQRFVMAWMQFCIQLTRMDQALRTSSEKRAGRGAVVPLPKRRLKA